MFPKTFMGDYVNWKWNDFRLTSAISGTTLIVTLRAFDETKISGFNAVVLVFSTANVAFQNSAKGWNMSMIYQSWNDPKSYLMSIFAPNFGPSFHQKCLFGFFQINYKGSKSFSYLFTNTPSGNFSSMDLPDDSQLNPKGYFFCFGNQSSQCGQTQSIFDNISQTCHSPTKCPLKQFQTWTDPDFCPKCTQLICRNCTASNRKHCLQCGINSTLSNGLCICNPDSWPFTTSISTATQGLWDGTVDSLAECRYNCTAKIPNCVFDKCDSETFCTECLAGFYLEVTGSTTNQGCINCTTLDNCIQCTDAINCTLCTAKYFPLSGVCTLCGEIILHCNECNDSLTCNKCDLGYDNVAPDQCICSPFLNQMENCGVCTFPTACEQCENLMFFINETDSMCHSCRNFDPFCLTCSAQNYCESCDTGYIILTIDSHSLCKACWDLFPNCLLCSSSNGCDVCNETYGLTTSAECQICNNLLMPGCQSCIDSTECLVCINSTHLINGECFTCDTILNCQDCLVNLAIQLECVKCLNGFYLNISAQTGKPQCRACMHFTDYCETCNNLECLSCIYPYLIGSDGLCSKCEPDFYYVSGICTKIAGCIRAAYLPNGTTTCIACAPKLFFIFDDNQKKCLCMQGFKDFNSIGSLPECRSVCGDGIVVSQFQECDDNNTVSRDGCDQNCKKEMGFNCQDTAPSKCFLELNVVSFTFNHVSRVLGQNKAVISFTILPSHAGLQSVEWIKLINLKFPNDAVTQSHILYSYTAQTGQLRVTVPCNQQLQDTTLETQLKLDPKFIKSTTPFLFLVNKMKGINAKLIFEEDAQLQTHKNINSITFILTILLLLVFYIGSYVHKMIGLETIQVIQAIYFVRMVTPSSSSSLLGSINGLQYATSGYQNSEWLYGDIERFEGELNACTTEQFTIIDLKKLFILNANFSFIPILLAIISYAIAMMRKYRTRNQFMETKDQELKDKYTQLQRSSQWLYDHFVFPYIMMFNLINFFQCVSLLSVPFETELVDLKKIEAQSFLFHIFMVLCATSIYCFEISTSYQEYLKYSMPEKERQRIPKSAIEKLEHDQNNNDRPNYHPAYVLCNLIYHFLLSIIMVLSVILPEFNYSLEFTLGTALIYFVFIWIWQPYHKSINSHNNFLRIYNAVFVVFLIICNLFVRLPKLSGTIYTTFIYLIVILLGVIVLSGFVRIFLERKFRGALQRDSSVLSWNKKEDLSELLIQQDKLSFDREENKQYKGLKERKMQPKFKNNIYAFDNQLFEINKKINNLSPKTLLTSSKLSQQDKSYLMKKVREDIQLQRMNNIVQSHLSKQYYRFEHLRKSPVSQKEFNLKDKKLQSEKTVLVNLIHKIGNSEQKLNNQISQEMKVLKSLKQKLRAELAYMFQE